jgi:hypothetical protein
MKFEFATVTRIVSLSGHGKPGKRRKRVQQMSLENSPRVWEAPIMEATMTDDRRRLVMPPELPARSAVTIQQLDEDTFIVRRQRPGDQMLVVLEPDVRHLTDDSKMDALGEKLSRRALKKFPKFDEL